MPVTAIESLAQFRTLIEGDKTVVVDFWATWCGPCKVISPVFEKLSGEYETLIFGKVDVDTQEDIAQEYKISAMPTFLFFKNGDQVGKIMGANPTALKAAIEGHA